MAAWRILVVDDETYVAMAIREVLETLPAEVVEAYGGEEALRLARAERPDLILLDVKMPGMSGFEVAEALKQDPGTAGIPIVFLSALGSSKEKVRGLDLGAEDYLTKPIDADELRARIRRALRHARPAEVEAAGVSSGSLEVMGLATLIRLFEKDRRTGTLGLSWAAERGEVLFVDGHVMQAAQGPRQAERAVYHLLTWRDGQFEMAAYDPGRQVGGEVTAPNQALLLEGQRRLEEIPSLRQRLGSPDGPLRVPPAVRTAIVQRASRDTVLLIELMDGTRSLDHVMAESPFDAWMTLKVLADLQAVGGVEAGVPESDRRGGLRLKVGIPIQYQGIGVWQESASFNLSGWGVFVRTAVPYDVGSQVLLRFDLPGSQTPVTSLGKVIWSNPDPSKWSGMGMGIEFFELAEEDRRAIEGYLAQMVASRIAEIS